MIYTDYKNVEDVVYDVDAINNSIKNILLTRRGSLPGKPTFGSDLDKLIFNQMDHITHSLIKTGVIESLRKWEPRVLVENVIIKEAPEYNRITVSIMYSYVDKGLSQTATTNINFSV